MERRNFVLSIVSISLVPLAGCNGDGQPDNDRDQETQDDATTSPETDTGTSDESVGFGPSTNTDSIILRLSDLSNNYEYSGETNVTTADLEESERAQYESDNIVRQHSRSFQRSSRSDGPVLIYSEATVYEHIDDVDSQLSNIKSTFRDQSAEIETVDLATGVSATQITHENDRETQNVLIYYQQDNLLLLVITSGTEEYYPDKAEELMVKMISDIN